MYQAGDKIIYGSSGVCAVMEICTPNFSRAEWGKKYYKLRPVYGTETIYAPVDTQAFMRPVMTRQQAEELIVRIPEIESRELSGHSITLLRQQYEDLLKGHDCETYIGIVKGIYNKGRSRKLGQTDQRYMKRAEDILYGELAVALDLTPDQVPERIKTMLEGS